MTQWEAMWARGLRPGMAFDAAQVEPALQALIDSNVLPIGHALVPGCGRGYAVAALAARALRGKRRQVLGIDISATAVQEAQKYIEGLDDPEVKSHASVAVADFFNLKSEDPSGKFVLGYDCTFLCAIPPELRVQWAQAWTRHLSPGGELVALLFPCPSLDARTDPADEPAGRGPPYTISLKLARKLLEPQGFTLLDSQRVPDGSVARGGSEVIARFRAPSLSTVMV